MNKLYHKDIFLPADVRKFCNREYKLTFSSHAKDACRNDRYGFIIPPTRITFNLNQVIETELNESGNIVKLVVRLDYDKDKDLVIAFIPDYEDGFVKSLWLNVKTDGHKTLRKELYQPLTVENI